MSFMLPEQIPNDEMREKIVTDTKKSLKLVVDNDLRIFLTGSQTSPEPDQNLEIVEGKLKKSPLPFLNLNLDLDLGENGGPGPEGNLVYEELFNAKPTPEQQRLTHRSEVDRFICVGDSDPEKFESSQSDKSEKSEISEKSENSPKLELIKREFEVSKRTFAQKLNQIPEMSENLEDSHKMVANSTEEDMTSLHKTQFVKSRFDSIKNSPSKILTPRSHNELPSREILSGHLWPTLDQDLSYGTPKSQEDSPENKESLRPNSFHFDIIPNHPG